MDRRDRWRGWKREMVAAKQRESGWSQAAAKLNQVNERGPCVGSDSSSPQKIPSTSKASSSSSSQRITGNSHLSQVLLLYISYSQLIFFSKCSAEVRSIPLFYAFSFRLHLRDLVANRSCKTEQQLSKEEIQVWFFLIYHHRMHEAHIYRLQPRQRWIMHATIYCPRVLTI